MPKERETDSHGGFTLSKIGASQGAILTRGGRPELESNTPVNIEN
jgi:hypothetical protein